MPIDLAIHDWPLPYTGQLIERRIEDIDLVVVHCTELPDLDMAREYGERVLYENSATGNSGHYYIDRDGSVHGFVATTRVAHHTRGFNDRSIGIELVNRGRFPDWLDSRRQTPTEPYSAAQIDALIALLRMLADDHPNLQWIAGHEDLDRGVVPASDDSSLSVRRKQDPGPLFPWQRVLGEVPLSRMPEN